jgi:tRNA A37 threonylcarbamoyladenosine synthetase subunit TsaC/SUA5/YrdC
MCSSLAGIRVPDAPFIRAVCRQQRGALALTSANISSGLSPMHIGEFQVGPDFVPPPH